MSYQIVLNIQNSEAIIGDVDELSTPGDNVVSVRNPRRLDGRNLDNPAENVPIVYGL